jgi:hypothetical protein
MGGIQLPNGGQGTECSGLLRWRGSDRIEGIEARKGSSDTKDISRAGAPVSEALRGVARRLFWWLPAEEALTMPIRFAAQVMTYGNLEDVETSLRVLGEDVFRQVLQTPPAGVFDRRSWVYWHCRFDIAVVPPLPGRELK